MVQRSLRRYGLCIRVLFGNSVLFRRLSSGIPAFRTWPYCWTKRAKPTALLLPYMPDLAATQDAFAAALVDADHSDDAVALIDANDAVARARLSVYRNNILANARNALAATFPIVLKIVGAE